MKFNKVRKYPRVASKPDDPITVSFKQKELQELTLQMEVRDISMVGIGIKVPLGKRFLKEGLVVEDMVISLPGTGKCTLSGKIVYKRLGQIGIEFMDSKPTEYRKLEEFTSRELRAEKHRLHDSQ
jgi:c-di-GMP-binding flagellar brake protein YcgR